MKAAKCYVCDSAQGLRRFVIKVDDQEAELAPTLCIDHGEQYLLGVGKVIGSLVRQIPVPEQSALAVSLEEALGNAAELAPDSIVILDVVERWHGDRAAIVLRAAAELAAYTAREPGMANVVEFKTKGVPS